MSYIKRLLNPFIATQSREKLLYINNRIRHTYDFSILTRAGLNLVNLVYENERQLVKLINTVDTIMHREQYIPTDPSHHFGLVRSPVIYTDTCGFSETAWVGN